MLIVVTGPPAGGKSTWVRGQAKPGDVVVDYDLIAGALSGPSRTGATSGHDHHGVVRKVAFRARSAAIAEALRHVADVDVYIIHSLPPPEALARYAEHDAQLVTIDPGRDVVMARIEAERPASARAVASRWYNNQAAQGEGRQGRAPAPRPQGAGPRHPLHTPPPRSSRSW